MYITPDNSLVDDVTRTLDAGCMFQLVVDRCPRQVVNVTQTIDDLDVLRMVVDKCLFTRKINTNKYIYRC